MIYNAMIHSSAKEVGSEFDGISFENVTIDGAVEIVKFAMEFGKSVSIVAVDCSGCDDDSCDV